MATDSEENSAFLMTFAHDLRHPLRSIVMTTQRMQRGAGEALSSELRAKLDDIVAAARKQEELIASVVEYDQAAFPTEAAPLALRLAIQTACMKVDAYRQSKNGSIRFEADQAPKVQAPMVLTSVLEKILHNSLKFHAAGNPPEVDIESIEETLEGAGSDIVVRVWDEGLGIEPQYRETVFEPFKKLNAAHEYAGSGLGLSICKRLISQVKGSVRIADSRSGKGVGLIVRFPRLSVEN